MGDKALARSTMSRLGLPTIPGSNGPFPTEQAALESARDIGFPMLVKAVAGGGGRGMRVVEDEDGFVDAWRSAGREASSAFGDGRLYMERLLRGARHIEVQIAADGQGNVVHFGERECSLQRRHQKVLEEAPSVGLSDSARTTMFHNVCTAVAASGYRSVGTVEMLADQTGAAYFLEMNTRLQVEHGVSELLTGQDLVEWQLRIAANAGLPSTQDEVVTKGHAIECRINAEDPSDAFRPSPGTVRRLVLPEGEGVRVDTHLSSGDRIPPHYDATVAKILTHGATRTQAIERMDAALVALRVEGVRTNTALHLEMLKWPCFVEGDYDIGTLERQLAGGTHGAT
jgi:acetyl-CoA carboxylase biotin carboxylase subunit